MNKLLNIPIKMFYALKYSYDQYSKYKNNLNTNKNILHLGKKSSLHNNVVITHPSRVYIGENSIIQSNTIISSIGGVHIGNYVGIGYDTILISFNHNYLESKTIPYDNGVILKPIIIRDYAWIAWRAVILPGVEIGEGAIIGVGSVVTKNVPSLAIVSGNPACVIGYRSKEKFENCKIEGLINSHRILEEYGHFDEKIPFFIKKRYEKELRELKML